MLKSAVLGCCRRYRPQSQGQWAHGHMAQSSGPDGAAKAPSGALQDTSLKENPESLKFHGSAGGTGVVERGSRISSLKCGAEK